MRANIPAPAAVPVSRVLSTTTVWLAVVPATEGALAGPFKRSPGIPTTIRKSRFQGGRDTLKSTVLCIPSCHPGGYPPAAGPVVMDIRFAYLVERQIKGVRNHPPIRCS
jgi:hypothetical protein